MNAPQFLNLSEVMNLVRLKKTRLYALIRDQRFPKPFKPGSQRNLWLASEVHAFLTDRIAARGTA